MLDLLGGERVGAEEFQIVAGSVETLVGSGAEGQAEDEVEDAVLAVLLVGQRQGVGCRSHGQVLLEVDEVRLDGFHLGVLNLADKIAHLIAVGRDGCNLGLLDFLDVGVVALTLEYGDVVVGEVAVGEGYDVLLCQCCNAVDAFHGVFPLDAVDEGILEHRCAGAVVLHLLHFVQLHVVDDGRQQVVGEVAALELSDFGEQEVAGFLQGLAFTGISGHEEEAVVSQLIIARPGAEHQHLLVDVEVDESRASVAEHFADERQRVRGTVLGSGELPAQIQALGFQTEHGRVHRLRQGRHGSILRLAARRVGLPLAEVLFQRGNGLFGVEVAGMQMATLFGQ